MIRAVAFDFGNVLSAFSHSQGCRQIAALAGPAVTESQVQQWLYEGDRFHQLEMGRLAPQQFLEELGRAFQVDDLAALRRAYQQIFTRLPESCELIARVKLPKFLASNTDPLHWEEIERHFSADFSGFVPGGLLRSFETGHRKPSPGFFAHLLDRIRRSMGTPELSPEEVLFVDDLPENCEAGRDCGFAVHLHLNHDVAALEMVLRDVGALSNQSA
jgi:HAD superfamily hydrolase (TIGR01509 family)